jgi:hypothetical protein
MLGQQSDVDHEIEGRTFWRACLIAAIVGVLATGGVLFVFIRAGVAPGPKLVYQIPATFPKQFILYRPEQIYEIYTYPASAKRSAASFALAPLRLLLRATGKSDLPTAFQGVVNTATDRDTASFAWKDVASSTPQEIFEFYAGSFKEVGLTNPYVRMLEDRSVIEMVATSTVLNASLVITDRPGMPTVDTITLIVDYPSGGIGLPPAPEQP